MEQQQATRRSRIWRLTRAVKRYKAIKRLRKIAIDNSKVMYYPKYTK